MKFLTVLKALWAWLDGKKRNIALIYWMVVTPCIPIVWPIGTMPDTYNKIYLVVGVVLSAFGLGHAAAKNLQERKAAAAENSAGDDSKPTP